MERDRVMDEQGKAQRKVVCGFISGKTNAQKLIIYGVCFALNENSDSIFTILRDFFMFTGSDCDALITDMGPAIISAVRKLSSS